MMSEEDKADIGALVKEASAIDQAELRALIKVATEEAINETFKVMGIDVNDFEYINDFRENHSWVKKYRSMAEKVGSVIIVTLTTALTGGVIAAVWAYIQSRGN